MTKKKVIAIISVLKPVDDTRNFEKVGRSISNTNKYDINIIGFSTKNTPPDPNINFHPLFNCKRISIGRFIAPLKMLKLLLKLKPELIIVTCAELLIVSILYKILFGCKIIYDIHENYLRNIIYSGAYNPALKYPLAWAIRGTELFSSLFVSKFILAEKIYSDQLNFVGKKAVVIENKAIIPSHLLGKSKSQSTDITFLYTGTIAEHYGIFDAIELVIRLRPKINTLKLVIIGHAPQSIIYHKLIKQVKKLDYIKIIGGGNLVPHDQILMEVNRADFCLLPYHASKSTEGRIPTKLYECLSMEKPVIISPNDTWNSLIHKNNAGIIYNFENRDQFPLDPLSSNYYGNNVASNYSWKNTESLLLATIEELMS